MSQLSMSARKRRLILQPDAQADIDEILLYTRKRWSAEQRRRYRAQRNKGMRSLLDYPERGLPRDDLYRGCRSLPVEQHVVFYSLDDDKIVVDRVLHTSQEPTGKVTQ
jgi:toxin ParE1/3/4